MGKLRPDSDIGRDDPERHEDKLLMYIYGFSNPTPSPFRISSYQDDEGSKSRDALRPYLDRYNVTKTYLRRV